MEQKKHRLLYNLSKHFKQCSNINHLAAQGSVTMALTSVLTSKSDMKNCLFKNFSYTYFFMFFQFFPLCCKLYWMEQHWVKETEEQEEIFSNILEPTFDRVVFYVHGSSLKISILMSTATLLLLGLYLNRKKC